MKWTVNRLVVALAVVGAVQAAEQHATKNPIRRVVTMLQMMQKKVTEEGKKSEALFEKYMCYCKNGAADLSKSIESGGAKAEELVASVKVAQGQKVQTLGDLKNHKADREAAKESMSEVTSIRDKEAAEFAKVKADAGDDSAALNKAIAAISKGMAGGFLQTGAAKALQQMLLANQNIMDSDRQDVLSFLSGKQGYAPQAGEINGILKQMLDEMAAGFAAASAAESDAIKNYNGLMAAKGKEVKALTKVIEEKLGRSGELSVTIATMQNEMDDLGSTLAEDKEFLVNLKTNCEKQTKHWEENKKTRAQELTALAETINILNDDDALELFKKTLPSAAASFVQVMVSSRELRARALAVVQNAQAASGPARLQLDFIGLALLGKKKGFDVVVEMTDDLVALLKKEQLDDDKKKEYCGQQFDEADDKKKSFERSVSDSKTAIANAEEGIATLTAEIEALTQGIIALDKSVAEATQNRKDEHAEFKELIASDAAAKELIRMAKNRLQQFYNPKLAKATPSFLQVSALEEAEDAPKAPESVGEFKAKSEESNGVMAMMDLLAGDLDKEMTVAETSEKDAQAEYEQTMKDSKVKRVEDSKALGHRESAKAEMETRLQSHQDALESDGRTLHATNKLISSLHGECDWLLQNFGARQEARNGEIDAMGKAKAILNGADYSLLQTTSLRNLRGPA